MEKDRFMIISMTPHLVDPNSMSSGELLDLLASELISGAVVGFATDTVFGLVADASNCGALAAIAEIKGREPSISMPVIIGERKQLDLLVPPSVLENANIIRLLDRFWPGPLTVILPLRKGVLCDDFFPAGTVGVRLPDDERLQAIARRVGPIVATSANKHGMPTLSTGRGVIEQLARDDEAQGLALVLDESSRSDRASTIVEVKEGSCRVIRVGKISAEAVASAFCIDPQE